VADELAKSFQKILEDKNVISQWTEDQHLKLQSMDNTSISSDSVFDKLQNLRLDKFPGPNGLHPMFLKSCDQL